MLQAQRKRILTWAQILVTKNKQENQELLHSYFSFKLLLIILMISYGKKLSNSSHKPVAHSYIKLSLLLDIHKIPIIAVQYTQLISYTEVKNKLSTPRAPSGQISGNPNKSFLPHNNERHAPSIIKPFAFKECYSSKKSFIIMQCNLLDFYRVLLNKPACL